MIDNNAQQTAISIYDWFHDESKLTPTREQLAKRIQHLAIEPAERNAAKQIADWIHAVRAAVDPYSSGTASAIETYCLQVYRGCAPKAPSDKGSIFNKRREKFIKEWGEGTLLEVYDRFCEHAESFDPPPALGENSLALHNIIENQEALGDPRAPDRVAGLRMAIWIVEAAEKQAEDAFERGAEAMREAAAKIAHTVRFIVSIEAEIHALPLNPLDEPEVKP